jgi:FixJ family two-component response regulator
VQHDDNLDALLCDRASGRYHIFLLQTGVASICQNPGMAVTDHPRRSVVAAVDDDQRILRSLELLLESADYDVRLFSSATALLESGGLREIDCLISDIGMPVMDGFELVRGIQAARPGLPVILVTGRPDLLNRAPLDWPSHYRVFKKPFNGQELLTAVGDALRSPHLPTAGP